MANLAQPIEKVKLAKMEVYPILSESRVRMMATLRADRRHVWTAEAIFPELADEYRRLSKALGKRGAPLNVIVSGSGGINLRLPVFTSGKVPALIVTTTAGAKRLRKQSVPDSVEIRAIPYGEP